MQQDAQTFQIFEPKMSKRQLRIVMFNRKRADEKRKKMLAHRGNFGTEAEMTAIIREVLYRSGVITRAERQCCSRRVTRDEMARLYRLFYTEGSKLTVKQAVIQSVIPTIKAKAGHLIPLTKDGKEDYSRIVNATNAAFERLKY